LSIITKNTSTLTLVECKKDIDFSFNRREHADFLAKFKLPRILIFPSTLYLLKAFEVF